MENPDLQGVLGVVPTPFTEDGELDENGLAHLVRHVRESGLHGAVILGSNGEFPYLTFEEKLRVLKRAARAADGRLPLIAGVSAVSTRESVILAREAQSEGYAAVLAALPLYFQVDFKEVKKHFTDLVQEGGLPVIFYYFPDVTGLFLSPDQIAEISLIEGIHGAKITVMNRGFLKKVIARTRSRLWAVFAGTSFMLRDSLHLGGSGVICPFPLIAPQPCLAIYEALREGKMDRARRGQDELIAAWPIASGSDMPGAMIAPYFKAMIGKPYTGAPERPFSSVAMIKEALRLQGHPITAVVRAPAPPLAREQAVLVKKTLKALGWM